MLMFQLSSIHCRDNMYDDCSNSSRTWNVFGRKLPRNEIVYFTQIIMIYIIISTGLYQLTNSQSNTDLWISLLSANIGYILPSPKIKKNVI